jgi:glycosyltransferase involved in cell wall biosynthesis
MVKILSFGDNPLTSTGYGCVWNNLLTRWKKMKPEWDFYHVGWQSRDRPHETKEGYFILPMGKLEYGYDVCYSNIIKYQPEFLVTLADVGWQSGFIEAVFAAKKAGWRGKWIMYTPMDTHSWAMGWSEIFDKCDINVAMAKFGEQQMKLHNVPNIVLIEHGVDLEDFHPLDKIKTKKKVKIEDKFVVGFVGRNQTRKMLDRIMLGFSHFAKDKNDVVLMLHTDEEPPQQGWSLKYMQWLYKIEDKLKLTKTNLDVYARQNIEENTMNEIYNFMDVFCYGTGGEGFGLPAIECQAAGVPLLMTDCTTALDLCREENKIAVLKDSYGRDVENVGTNGVAFKVPDDVKMAELLEKRYLEWKEGKLAERGIEARKFAEQYNWDLISKKWIDLFEKEI